MLHSQFSILNFPFSKLDLHSYGVIAWRPLIAWQAKEIPRCGCRRNRHRMTLGALFKTRFAFVRRHCMAPPSLRGKQRRFHAAVAVATGME